MVKMLGLIEQLSCDIGERFAGTPGEHKAADVILRAFQQFDGGTHLDEINFLGWRSAYTQSFDPHNKNSARPTPLIPAG